MAADAGIEKVLDTVAGTLKKEFGAQSAGRADNLNFFSVVRAGLPSGIPAIDRAIGRPGWPFGRIVEFYGEEAHGKSSLAFSTLAQAQRRGCLAVLLDSESGFDPVWADKLGLNRHQLIFLQGDEDLPTLTVEGVFARLFKLVEAVQKVPEDKRVPLIVVWDSVGGTPSQAELERDPDEKGYAGASVPIAANIKKLSSLIQREMILPILVNQIRDNIGVMYGDKLRTPGGHALKHFASVRVNIVRTGWVSEGVKDSKEHVGQTHEVRFKKNKVLSPGRRGGFNILYDTGIDFADAMLEEAILCGWVKKEGKGVLLLSDTGEQIDDWAAILNSHFGGIEKFYETWLDYAQKQRILVPYGQPELGAH